MDDFSSFQLIAIPITGLALFVALLRIVHGSRPRWSNWLAAIISLAAGAAIYEPEITTTVARLLGIGRGADLLIYGVVIAFVISWFYFYQQHRKLQSALTSLVRKLAVDEALKRDDPTADTTREPPGDDGEG